MEIEMFTVVAKRRTGYLGTGCYYHSDYPSVWINKDVAKYYMDNAPGAFQGKYEIIPCKVTI